MIQSRQSLLTADDIYQLPDDDFRHELVRGKVVSEPPVGYRHGQVAMAIGSALQNYARDSGRDISITCEVGFHLSRNPDTVLGPDVAVLRGPRLAELDDASRFFPGPPDLAVEVLSPWDQLNAVRDKASAYLDAGTLAVWIVDPQQRNVFVCTSGNERVVTRGETLDEPGLLPGFFLVVSELFGAP